MPGERSEGGGYKVRFLVDRMLGALARNLRMVGFDASYAPGGPWRSLLERAVGEGRWLLTKKYDPTRARFKVPLLKILHDDPGRQVVQVLRSLHLTIDPTLWLGRCLRCNTPLSDLTREEARPWVPEYVAYTQGRFRRCPSCGRVFWPGTHSDRMLRTIEEWIQEARAP
jgi:uncharacterized protein with PIN domain